jgi:8-oxo-dGTP pyrophosphatase MutT (NUDIX family)
LSEPLRLLEVGELDLTFEPSRWAFAERRAASIAAHWARMTRAKPALFNGRVLLLGPRSIETGADGGLKFKGVFFETDYADFLAWEEFGEPGEPVDNCFSMAALRGADGAFLLGEMAKHTFNAGQIYFPAGTPDPTDVFDDRVDLEASAGRELFEETGVGAEETIMAPEWTLVFTPKRIACMKLMTLPVPAEQAKERIEAYLAQDPHAEFSRMHVIRGPRDIDEARVPVFVAAYLRVAFAQRSVGYP